MKGEFQSEIVGSIVAVAAFLRREINDPHLNSAVLPFTLLRRLACIHEPSEDAALAKGDLHQCPGEEGGNPQLMGTPGEQIFNWSLSALQLLSDKKIADDLMCQVSAYSSPVRLAFKCFRFDESVRKLSAKNVLQEVVQRFARLDLGPTVIADSDMGLIFTDLVHRFAESAVPRYGTYLTPWDVLHLTTSLVTAGTEGRYAPNSLLKVYDATAGTGGLLLEMGACLKAAAENLTIELYGQEVSPQSYAILLSSMIIRGQDASSIALSNSLLEDQFADHQFDLMISRPPFGIDWKELQPKIQKERVLKGLKGRFGPGLPRVTDASLLYLLNLTRKMRPPNEGGSRIGIILNGPSLFSGGAGTGESDIRRHLLENDLVEAIVGLPTEMFFDNGNASYLWILTNSKEPRRQGVVQLIDASGLYETMGKPRGSKRHAMTAEHIAEINRIYRRFEESPESKILRKERFGYRRITIDQPLRLSFRLTPEAIEVALQEKSLQKLDLSCKKAIRLALSSLIDSSTCHDRELFLGRLKNALRSHDVRLSTHERNVLINALGERNKEASVCLAKGVPEPDPSLRETEDVPLGESVQGFFEREVRCYVPDAWIDETKTDPQDGLVGVVGYEIPFHRHFYVFRSSRDVREIDCDIKAITERINQMIGDWPS